VSDDRGDALQEPHIVPGEDAWFLGQDLEHPQRTGGPEHRRRDAADHAVLEEERTRREPVVGPKVFDDDRLAGMQRERSQRRLVRVDVRRAAEPAGSDTKDQRVFFRRQLEDAGELQIECLGGDARRLVEQRLELPARQREQPETGDRFLLSLPVRELTGDAPAFCDVLDDTEHPVDLVLGVQERRDRDAHVDARAVLAEPLRLEPGDRLTGELAPDQLLELLLLVLGYVRKRLAHDLSRGPAQHPFGGRVPVPDPTVLLQGDDPERRRFEHGAE
jgi:hypothetical protein